MIVIVIAIVVCIAAVDKEYIDGHWSAWQLWLLLVYAFIQATCTIRHVWSSVVTTA